MWIQGKRDPIVGMRKNLANVNALVGENQGSV